MAATLLHRCRPVVTQPRHLPDTAAAVYDGAVRDAYRVVMGHLARLRGAARRHPHADIAVAVTLFAVTLVTTPAGPQQAREPLTAVAVLQAAVACGVLAVRQRWPLPVLVVSTVAAEAYMVPYRGHQGWLVLAAPLIALYTAVEATGRRRALLVGGLAVLALGAAHTFLMTDARLGAENLALAALGGLAVAAGDASRNRRAYLAEVEERARRAESERDREASRRVTEERLRIARDLHDVVGHHLALINVQAGVAAHVLDNRPDQARQSLAHVRQAGRSALDELRDTVGLLREAGSQPAPTEPTAGMAGLAELIASFRHSGLRVDQEVNGAARTLAPAADVTAYRVIQESLTNVCKHASTPAARLRLVYQPAALRIEVDNDAAQPPPANGSPPGHGLVGMRERVVAVGGDLEAGPRPGGGFRVAATLPLPAGGAG
jgi:signal transduction histidine kinase